MLVGSALGADVAPANGVARRHAEDERLLAACQAVDDPVRLAGVVDHRPRVVVRRLFTPGLQQVLFDRCAAVARRHRPLDDTALTPQHRYPGRSGNGGLKR